MILRQAQATTDISQILTILNAHHFTKLGERDNGFYSTLPSGEQLVRFMENSPYCFVLEDNLEKNPQAVAGFITAGDRERAVKINRLKKSPRLAQVIAQSAPFVYIDCFALKGMSNPFARHAQELFEALYSVAKTQENKNLFCHIPISPFCNHSARLFAEKNEFRQIGEVKDGDAIFKLYSCEID